MANLRPLPSIQQIQHLSWSGKLCSLYHVSNTFWTKGREHRDDSPWQAWHSSEQRRRGHQVAQARNHKTVQHQQQHYHLARYGNSSSLCWPPGTIRTTPQSILMLPRWPMCLPPMLEEHVLPRRLFNSAFLEKFRKLKRCFCLYEFKVVVEIFYKMP